jgi:hypothetical protein
LFWQRDFRLFWFGDTAGALGTSVSAMTIPLVAVVVLRADPFAVSAVSAAGWLPWLILGVPAGAWVDSWQVRRVMLASNAACAVLYLSIPVAAWLDVLTVQHLIVVAFMAGIAKVFLYTASQVCIPLLLGRTNLVEGNAKLRGSESAAEIAGPGLGGALSGLVGAVGGLIATAAAFVLSFVFVRAVQPLRMQSPLHDATADKGFLRSMGEGLRFVVRDPYIRVLTAYGALTNAALIGFEAIQVPFLIDTLGVEPGVVGVLMTLTGLGGLLGAAFARRVSEWAGTGRAVILFAVCTAPLGMLIPLASSGTGLVFTALGGMSVTAGIAAGNIITGSFRQSYCPPAMLGRITSAMRMLRYSFIPFGALASGALATSVGTRPALWIVMVVMGAASWVLLIGPIRRSRDLPVEPATAT